MKPRLLSGDCIAAACCLLQRPVDQWGQVLDDLFVSTTPSCSSSLMSAANRLGRTPEPFWNDADFCDALIAVLKRVKVDLKVLR